MDTSNTLSANEPIPGYILEERLGRGGYGEVWKATAPGSLHKAVKLVHGFHDDEIAKKEMKALERIKEVRHPFLVSIERIEICEGQLVIVSELADMSLRDRFDECREAGDDGIARDKLLAYLHDVADALDYIREHHNLQHLDVKPENLMLVGDRLKVGDFGLVKDLQQVSASLMSALTPIYAPPELFDGRPHCHSDQYSLAIVYQEMLSGERPFRGTTAAQLTSQHLKDAPELDSVPTSDREILAKALAKNPDLRFGSCRELVDRLMDAGGSGNDLPSEAATDNVNAPDLAMGRTIIDSPVVRRSDEVPVASDIAPANAIRSSRVVTLPRIEVSQEDVQLRPTLFLGIGGTGERSLGKLRRRMADRFGETASIPAFQTLYVDADVKAIARATRDDNADALQPHQTLAMRLRSTQDYGVEKTKFLRWLSRRWLYNIPRSLNTEGRRALGRVAFVDHVEELLGRLKDIIAEMTGAAALAAAREATGCEFANSAPRVFIVASVCGGTGGGMVLDMAYAVRQVLREQGLSDDAVHGVLTYSSPRNPEAQELAIANAYATLTELHHYSSTGTIYPGATDCSLVASPSDDPTFPAVSFLHLGDGLTEEQFDKSADQVAEYLYLDATTACGKAFDDIRKTAKQSAPLDPEIVPLRTFGVLPRGGLQADMFNEVSRDLGQNLFGAWLGVERTSAAADDHETDTGTSDDSNEFVGLDVTDGTAVVDEADDAASDFVRQESDALAIDGLVSRFGRSAVERLGAAPETIVAGLVNGTSPAEHLVAIDRLTGSTDEVNGGDGGATTGRAAKLSEAVAADTARIGAEHGQSLCQRLLRLADRDGVRVRGALWVATQLSGQIETLRGEANGLMQLKEALLAQHRSAYLSAGAPRKKIAFLDSSRENTESSRNDILTAYLLAHLDIIAIQGVQNMLRSIGGQVSAATQELTKSTRCLEALGDRLSASTANAAHRVDTGLDINARLNAVARSSLAGRRDELTSQLDVLMREAWLDRRGGLASLCDGDPAVEDELTKEVLRHARATVFDAMKQLDLTGEIVSLAEVDRDGMECLREWLEDICPPALESGGAKTFLLAVGPPSASARVQELIETEMRSHCSVAPNTDSPLAVVCLGEQLSLASVASRLIQGRCTAGIAQRLHTRIDVDWKTMT